MTPLASALADLESLHQTYLQLQPRMEQWTARVSQAGWSEADAAELNRELQKLREEAGAIATRFEEVPAATKTHPEWQARLQDTLEVIQKLLQQVQQLESQALAGRAALAPQLNQAVRSQLMNRAYRAESTR